MKCSELRPDDQVVFHVMEDGKEKTYDGHVTLVLPEIRLVHVCYLEGYRSRDAAIPFSDMLAKYDEKGEKMTFDGWITGPSVLLEPA